MGNARTTKRPLDPIPTLPRGEMVTKGASMTLAMNNLALCISFVVMWCSAFAVAQNTTGDVHLDSTTTWVPLGVFVTALGASCVFIFMLGVTYMGWKTKINANKKDLKKLKEAVQELKDEASHHEGR